MKVVKLRIKSLNDNKTRIMAAWKLGTALAFPEFFVTNGL
jgi:hypothetical protein